MLFYTCVTPALCTPFKNPKNQGFAKMKKIAGDILLYYRFRHVYQKPQSYEIRLTRYGMRQTEFFCHFELFFALLPLKQSKF